MMEYTVIRSDRRTLALQIKNGELIVRAPKRVSDGQIRDFVISHSDWINKQLSLCQQQRKALEDVNILSEDECRELVKKARKVFAERAAHYAALLGVEYGKISVRRQRTRWGSCAANGNLSFNAALMLAPSEVLDSVVAHELCHRKYMNHSASFYRELEKVIPEYRACRKWLRDNGDVLMARMGNK